jgi:hypothetical protein
MGDSQQVLYDVAASQIKTTGLLLLTHHAGLTSNQTE